jgi:hypothetical protein
MTGLNSLIDLVVADEWLDLSSIAPRVPITAKSQS